MMRRKMKGYNIIISDGNHDDGNRRYEYSYHLQKRGIEMT